VGFCPGGFCPGVLPRGFAQGFCPGIRSNADQLIYHHSGEELPEKVKAKKIINKTINRSFLSVFVME